MSAFLASLLLAMSVGQYSDAFLTGDGAAAHELLTERCQRQLGTEMVQTYTEIAAADYGNQPIRSFTINDDGTVSYAYDDARINQDHERWILEDGRWKNDEC